MAQGFVVSESKSDFDIRFSSGLSGEDPYDSEMSYVMVNKRGNVSFNAVGLTKDIFNTLYTNSDLNNEDILKITAAATTWKAPKNMAGKVPVVMTEEGGGKSLSFQGSPRCQIIGTAEGLPVPFSKLALVTRPPRENGIHARIFVEEGNMISFGSVIEFPGGTSSKAICVGVYRIDSFIDIPQILTDQIDKWVEETNKELEDDPHHRFARQKTSQIRRLSETKYIGVNMQIIAASILNTDTNEIKFIDIKDDKGNSVYNTNEIIEYTMRKLETTSMTVDFVEGFGPVYSNNPETFKNHTIQVDEYEHEESSMDMFLYDFERIIQEHRRSLVSEDDQFARHHSRVGFWVRMEADKSLTFEGHLNRKHVRDDVAYRDELPIKITATLDPDDNDLKSLAGSPLVEGAIDASVIREKITGKMHDSKGETTDGTKANEFCGLFVSIF